jgi:hypothetical protein
MFISGNSCGSGKAQDDEDVIDMNEARCRDSAEVQRAARKLASMIDGSGHPAGQTRDPLTQETTMLKAISAALLAVSVLAAPALAANPAKPIHATAIKAERVKQAKPNTLSATTKMARLHRHFRHHRFHKHIGAVKTRHHFSKMTVKHLGHASKRG